MSTSTRNQYIAGTLANLITASYGAFVGWASASFIELQSLDSPLDSGPLNNDEAGWIGSMLCVGGAIGTALFAWCASKIGRKKSLLLMAIPGLLGWLIIPISKTPLHLAISRLMGGMSGGGAFAVVPIYAAELSEDKIRGSLGTFLILSCNFGVLLAFILGNYYSSILVAWMLSSLPLVFLVCFAFMPETPQYLASQNKMGGAERSLCFFRNVKSTESSTAPNIQSELKGLINHKSKSVDNPNEGGQDYKDFCEKKARKALVIGVGLMAINQFSGCFVLLNYTATIFQQAGSDIPPNIAAIVVGVIQLLGSYVSTLLVDRAGRKVLLIISAIGTGIGLACLGAFIHIGGTGVMAWALVASFSFTIFIGCWGVITLPIVVVAEIMPPKLRGQGCMVCMLVLWIFSFFLVKYMGVFAELLGLHGVMFSFAVCCFVGAVCVVFFVPETKGKSIEEILEKL